MVSLKTLETVGLYPELLDKLMEALKGNYSTQVLYTDEQVDVYKRQV